MLGEVSFCGYNDSLLGVIWDVEWHFGTDRGSL